MIFPYEIWEIILKTLSDNQIERGYDIYYRLSNQYDYSLRMYFRLRKIIPDSPRITELIYNLEKELLSRYAECIALYQLSPERCHLVVSPILMVMLIIEENRYSFSPQYHDHGLQNVVKRLVKNDGVITN